MRFRRLAPLVLAAPLLGCFESATPIADASTTPIDPRVAGEWRCVTPHDDETVRLTFTKTSEAAYDVVLTPPDENEKKDRYRASSARLDGAALVNVQQVAEDGTPGKWVLIRYTLHKPALLELEVAADAVFEAEKKAPPREVASRHLKAGDLFEPFCACVRVIKR
jgi:hypothetical protein